MKHIVGGSLRSTKAKANICGPLTSYTPLASPLDQNGGEALATESLPKNISFVPSHTQTPTLPCVHVVITEIDHCVPVPNFQPILHCLCSKDNATKQLVNIG